MGPIGAIWASIWLSPYYIFIYIILVLFIRTAYILLLTIEGHRVSITDIPMLLYTQWIGSIVKIYTLFHLHQQEWDSHRQASDGTKQREPLLDFLIPKMEMVFSYAVLILIVIRIVGVK